MIRRWLGWLFDRPQRASLTVPHAPQSMAGDSSGRKDATGPRPGHAAQLLVLHVGCDAGCGLQPDRNLEIAIPCFMPLRLEVGARRQTFVSALDDTQALVLSHGGDESHK